jgi:hypothetical protein
MPFNVDKALPEAGHLGGASAPSTASTAGGPAIPASFDWRSRGVVGPVRDQEWCGSCVSFATTGLLCTQAAIELGAINLEVSEADQHFCSSHGANCGGWNNGDALGQIQSRGVVSDATFPYMTAFDNPPQPDPNEPDPPNPDLWLAHCRGEANRGNRTWSISGSTAWNGDDRKTYLATVGPLVCGFTVYDDFQQYGGGVYRQTWGNVEGGHAVLVIGYDDNEQCWICRNSWGTGFGGAPHPDGTGGGFFKIGYGECGIDGEAMMGCHGVIAPATAPLMTGVSRSTNFLDIFVPGTDHGTYTAAWQPGDTQWGGWWDVQTGVTAPRTFIHGVSRSANKLDIFAVGTDNGTYTAAWQPGDTHWGGWWRVQGGVVAPGSSITAVSRSADHLDIFCVGTDHGIYTAAWQPGDTSWQGWWRIGNLVAAPNTSVWGVSRSTDKLDIFAVGSDLGIYTAAWQPGDTSWQGWWRIQGGVAAPNTSVTAVSRSADHLDIFAVGADHGIYTAAWQPGDTSWEGWWRIQGGIAAPNTSVFGVSRSTDKLDIFAVGTDHGIYTAAWQPGDTSWQGWWRLSGEIAAAGTSVYPVSRSTDNLDVFAIGSNYGTYTTHWQPGENWQPWTQVQGGIASGG